MNDATSHPLPIGTLVEFDIAQGLTVGRGVVLASRYDDGWLYRLHVQQGDQVDMHRDRYGELWLCQFEVWPVAEQRSN